MWLQVPVLATKESAVDTGLLNVPTSASRLNFPQRPTADQPFLGSMRSSRFYTLDQPGSRAASRSHMSVHETVMYLMQLLPIAVQLALFADGGGPGAWCSHLDRPSSPMGGAPYRVACRLLCEGWHQGHLQQMLRLQLLRQQEELAQVQKQQQQLQHDERGAR
jgi:hypothetical protein